MSENMVKLVDGRLSITSIGSIDVIADLSLQMPDGAVTNTYHRVTSWDGRLPQALFHFLVDKYPVTRDEIFLAFWPELSVKEATNVFHVTKRKIAQAVGTEVTRYASGFYWLADNLELFHDALELEANWEKLVATNAAPEEWIELTKLCQGQYLQNIWWVGIDERRAHLDAIQADVLIHAAEVLQWDQPKLAFDMLNKALQMTPLRDDAVLMKMQIMNQNGYRVEAINIYDRYQLQVQEALGNNVKPDESLIQFKEQLRSA